MNRETIVRAWKEPEFRARLTADQRGALPENPSGTPLLELSASALGEVLGGYCPPPPRVIILSLDMECSTNSLGCYL